MNENFEADFEGIVVGRSFGIDRVFCLYGVSSMTEKDTEVCAGTRTGYIGIGGRAPCKLGFPEKHEYVYRP